MLRVAIVGLGPKGLFALERLLDHAGALDGAAEIRVDVFEPHPAPGAGPNYDPAGPAYLRMNFAAEQVDMWGPASTVVPRDERPSFVAWRDRLGAGGDGGEYPARAQVGRYLSDGLVTILRHAPSAAAVTLRRARADVVRPRGEGWEVVAAGIARRYDEVLLATGHERPSGRGLEPGWAHAAPLVASVFPVGRLSSRRVAAGATVAVRGFALTFIDAALALTEGRGGSFQPLDHPYRLRYVSGDEDVRVIMPFSRTGRAMLAKPGRALLGGQPALAAIAAAGRARILAMTSDLDVRRDLAAVLAETASSALHAVGGTPEAGAGAAIGAWLAAVAGGESPDGDADPAEQLERSIEIGAGLRAPDATWALGHTWRALYPALVARLGGDGLAAPQWPAFRRLAEEMERIAFGPPPRNAAKLLALVDAGRVDLTHVRDARVVTRGDRSLLCSARGEEPVDVVVDAVLPGPGAAGARDQPLRGLLHAGHARVAAARRGLDVDADGACRGASGLPTPGLSAIGRVTEDVVIGNDTLSRTLHPLAGNWARRVVGRCRDDEVAVTGARRWDAG